MHDQRPISSAVSSQETYRRGLIERFVQSRIGKACLGSVGLILAGAALMPEQGGPQTALAQTVAVEGQAPLGLEHVKVDADKMLIPAALNVAGILTDVDKLPTGQTTRKVPPREKADTKSSKSVLPTTTSDPLSKITNPANNRSRVPVAAPPRASQGLEAAANTEPSPEQKAMTLADALLKHPKISFPSDYPRVRQSVEYLRDHGRTFKVDPNRIGKEETKVDPYLLQMIKDLADSGIEFTVSSLTTGEDHSPTSWHYEGQAVDLKFKKQSDLKKAFSILYKERDKLHINELIHGGDLPEGTTNLRKGDKFDYDQKNVLDFHMGHVHVSRIPGPPHTEKVAAKPESDKVSVIISSQPPSLPAYVGNLLVGLDSPLVARNRLLPRTPVPTPGPAVKTEVAEPKPAEPEHNVKLPAIEDMTAFKGITGEALKKLKEIHADVPMLKIFMAALQAQESSGNAEAVGPPIPGEDDVAFGYYQIMPKNWPVWSKQVFGGVMPQTPENQQIVASFKMKEYYDNYKEWQWVAVAWFGGEGAVHLLRDHGDARVWKWTDGYMSIEDYVAKMQRGMDKYLKVPK